MEVKVGCARRRVRIWEPWGCQMGLGKDVGGRTTWPVLPTRTAVVMVDSLLCG